MFGIWCDILGVAFLLHLLGNRYQGRLPGLGSFFCFSLLLIFSPQIAVAMGAEEHAGDGSGYEVVDQAGHGGGSEGDGEVGSEGETGSAAGSASDSSLVSEGDKAAEDMDGPMREASLPLIAQAAHRPNSPSLRHSLTWTVFADWHGDNRNARDDDDNYQDLRNTGFGELIYGSHRVGLRLDTATFINPPDVRKIRGAGPPYANSYAVERLYYRYNNRHLNIQLGDFYKVLGKGLVLSVRRVDELGVDMALRGALMEWQGSSTSVSVLGGLSNTISLEPTEERLIIDKCTDSFADANCNPLAIYPSDLIAGMEVIQKLGRRVKAGARFVQMQLVDPDAGEVVEPRSLLGASLEVNSLAGLDFYFEGARLYRYEDALIGGDSNKAGAGSSAGDRGFALLGQASGGVGPLTFLLDGKWYDRYYVAASKNLDPSHYSTVGRTFFYQEPPNLDTPDMLVHNNTDTKAVRLRLDWALSSLDAYLYASGMAGKAYASSLGGAGTGVGAGVGAGSDETDILHIYGGVDGRISGFAYRVQGGERNEGDAFLHEKIDYVEANLRLTVARKHTVSLFGRHEQWYRSYSIGEALDFHKGTWSLGYNLAPKYMVAYIFSYDNEFETRHNMNQGKVEDVRTVFHGAEMSWRQSQSLSARLFAGSMRGGKGCVSGSCRTFPPFTGVKAEVVFRY